MTPASHRARRQLHSSDAGLPVQGSLDSRVEEPVLRKPVEDARRVSRAPGSRRRLGLGALSDHPKRRRRPALRARPVRHGVRRRPRSAGTRTTRCAPERTSRWRPSIDPPLAGRPELLHLEAVDDAAPGAGHPLRVRAPAERGGERCGAEHEQETRNAESARRCMEKSSFVRRTLAEAPRSRLERMRHPGRSRAQRERSSASRRSGSTKWRVSSPSASRRRDGVVPENSRNSRIMCAWSA